MSSTTGGAVFARVALFTRAWIEINCWIMEIVIKYVALFTRAWIEMKLFRFLKKRTEVALFTRAWIEILICTMNTSTLKRRPLHEGVD